MRLAIEDLRPGDFTFVTGYRQVVGIREIQAGSYRGCIALAYRGGDTIREPRGTVLRVDTRYRDAELLPVPTDTEVVF